MSETTQPINLGQERARRTTGRQIVLRRASLIPQTPVKWIWLGRIASGKMTLIGGQPSKGKSQITIDTVARITQGASWPDGGVAPLGSALILSAEDAASDTICPRLELAGADLDRVHIIESVLTEGGKASSFSLQNDLTILGERLKEIGDVRIIVIDPITAYLGDVDSHRTTDVRAILEPLDKFSNEHQVALFSITHPPKAAQNAMNSFTGSLAFVAAPRLAFMVADEPNSERRLFLPVKNNLGPLAAGLGYHIQGGTTKAGVDSSFIAWDSKPVRLSADEVLQEVEMPNSQIRNAENFLKAILANGPVAEKEVQENAKAESIAGKTLKRAKANLEIQSDKTGFGGSGEWFWKLPE